MLRESTLRGGVKEESGTHLTGEPKMALAASLENLVTYPRRWIATHLHGVRKTMRGLARRAGGLGAKVIRRQEENIAQPAAQCEHHCGAWSRCTHSRAALSGGRRRTS